MKFTLIYKCKESGRITAENYDKPNIDTVEQAKDQSLEWLEDFNAGLRPFETPRQFEAVLEGNYAPLINMDKVDYQNIKTKQLK